MTLSSASQHDHITALMSSATQFLLSHQGEHLDNDQLVKRCCAHLMATSGVTKATAEHYTMHALADVQGRHVPAYFDINTTTSTVVRVVDPRSGNVYALTASDILQLAKAQNDAPLDPTHGIHQCGRRAG